METDLLPQRTLRDYSVDPTRLTSKRVKIKLSICIELSENFALRSEKVSFLKITGLLTVKASVKLSKESPGITSTEEPAD